MTRPTRTIRHRRQALAPRWPRRLVAVAFALAPATVAFAATLASLASLAVPSPATPTVTTIIYLPVPAAPPATSPGSGR